MHPSATGPRLEATSDTIDVVRDRAVVKLPVFKFGKFFYAGETLSLLNPHGFDGKVWSGSTLERLEHNANFGGYDGTSH